MTGEKRMDDPGYEPLLDSKWAIPFVAIVMLFAMVAIVLIKIVLAAKRRAAKRVVAPIRPALADPSLAASLRTEHP